MLDEAYDTFQENQEKAQTKQLLELSHRKVHVRINQWQIIMIISISIQNIASKVWTDSFVAVNIHPHHLLYFSVWVKKIVLDVKTGNKAYSWNHKGSYYDMMPPI